MQLTLLKFQKDATEQATKELQDEDNSLKRAKDETVDYVDERVEEKIRTFGNFRNHVRPGERAARTGGSGREGFGVARCGLAAPALGKARPVQAWCPSGGGAAAFPSDPINLTPIKALIPRRFLSTLELPTLQPSPTPFPCLAASPVRIAA